MAATKDPIGQGLGLDDVGEDPSNEGEIQYNSGSFIAKDALGTFDLRAGVGLSAGSHRVLDQLVHLIAEDTYEEYNYTGNKVDSIIWWTDNGKTQKVREEIYTYTGNKVTTIVTKQYDGAGVLVTGETMTDTLNYTGNQLTHIDRVMS